MVGLFVFAFAQLSRFPDTVINFRTQMTTSYAELGETCVATTAQLGIVIFFCCAYATAAFRPVVPISILRDARTSLDATLAKCRCVVARAEKRTLYHSAGVVDTRHFAKIRVSQSDLRSKINHHAPDYQANELWYNFGHHEFKNPELGFYRTSDVSPSQ